MTKELELKVGGQYRTRGGWRAVVVNLMLGIDRMVVCHFDEEHNVGGIIKHQSTKQDEVWPYDYGLIAEWQEPKRGEVWVNVWLSGLGDVYNHLYRTKEEAEDDAKGVSGWKLLARLRMPWTEGDGLNNENKGE